MEDEDEDDCYWKIPNTFLSRDRGGTPAFYEYYECEDVFSKTRPLHNESTWMLLRGMYQGIVGPYRSTISIVDPITKRTNLHYESGFQVPYYTGQVPNGIGRGVFAALPIAKGTHIWSGSKNTAKFFTGQDFRQFLLSLPTDLACDVITWCYCQRDPQVTGENDDISNSFYIRCELEESSYVNMADTPEQENIGTKARMAVIDGNDFDPADYGLVQDLYALRDIQAGEQLLMDYTEVNINSQEGWEQLRLT